MESKNFPLVFDLLFKIPPNPKSEASISKILGKFGLGNPKRVGSSNVA